jgi:putative peptidoglycan lipid II flippase
LIHNILQVISLKLKYFTGAIGTVALIKLLLAVLALIKDILFASYMGTSAVADALLIAFFIPDTIGNGLIGATLGRSCVPLFSKFYAKEEYDKFLKYMLKINLYFLFVTGFISITILLYRSNFINAMGNGFSSHTRLISTELLTILVTIIPLFSVLAIGIAGNQVFGNFAVTTFVPVLFNLFFLIGIISCVIFKLPNDIGSYVISFFILISILSMVTMIYRYLFVTLKKRNIKIRFSISLKQMFELDENIKFLVKVFVPYFGVVLLSQATLYAERNMASAFGTGSIAALNYAYRLSQFPLLVFVGAIGTVTYPMMSKAIAKGDFDELKNVFYRSIKYALIVIIPMSIFLITFRKPIITILFFRGAFDSNSLEVTSRILLGYSLAIIGQSVTSVCLNFFLALGEATRILGVFLFSAILNIVANYYFVGKFGLIGIGYGAFCGASFNAILMFYIFKKRIHKME